MFTDQDAVLVTVGEDGFARRYDVESGKLLVEEQIHTEMITDMQVSTRNMHLFFDTCLWTCLSSLAVASYLIAQYDIWS